MGISMQSNVRSICSAKEAPAARWTKCKLVILDFKMTDRAFAIVVVEGRQDFQDFPLQGSQASMPVMYHSNQGRGRNEVSRDAWAELGLKHFETRRRRRANGRG